MRCRGLEWDDMGVKVDGWYLHHLRFADDFVLITSSINQAERMLAEFDETCKIDLQPNLDDVCEERMGWEINMMKDLTSGLGRRKRAAWGAFKSIEDLVKRTSGSMLTYSTPPFFLL
ncbi:hypothetical protein RB195_021893 [Necator americanus]|uniref:Reverse transcriptase domain-containing protein n=1 Tax=Necator americanus TaxID=51031 RepID=A0ABR1EDB7_NECAM